MYAGGWVSLREIVLFVMYLVGIVVAVPVAWLLRKTFFKGETPPFVMELPPYKWPSLRIVMARVYDRSKSICSPRWHADFCDDRSRLGGGLLPSRP